MGLARHGPWRQAACVAHITRRKPCRPASGSMAFGGSDHFRTRLERPGAVHSREPHPHPRARHAMGSAINYVDGSEASIRRCACDRQQDPVYRSLQCDRNPAAFTRSGCRLPGSGRSRLHCRRVELAPAIQPPVPSVLAKAASAADWRRGISRLVLAVEGGGQPGEAMRTFASYGSRQHRGLIMLPHHRHRRVLPAHSGQCRGCFTIAPAASPIGFRYGFGAELGHQHPAHAAAGLWSGGPDHLPLPVLRGHGPDRPELQRKRVRRCCKLRQFPPIRPLRFERWRAPGGRMTDHMARAGGSGPCGCTGKKSGNWSGVELAFSSGTTCNQPGRSDDLSLQPGLRPGDSQALQAQARELRCLSRWSTYAELVIGPDWSSSTGRCPCGWRSQMPGAGAGASRERQRGALAHCLIPH